MVYPKYLTLFSVLAFPENGLASMLPSFRADSASAESTRSSLESDSKWWVQFGDDVFHSPEKTSQLSVNIKDYYYAIGSESGVPENLKSHRVGGSGRWHIFHLPGAGASLLQTDSVSGDRRESISALKSLHTGLSMASGFPKYTSDADYKNPLSEKGRAVENTVVGDITSDSYKKYLTKLVDLGSRSWESEEASSKSVSLIEQEFKKLGYETCTHEFTPSSPTAEALLQTDRKLVNVLAFSPGKGTESVVVGAHYDSRPYSGPAPGAVDNGSGAAGLLEMARAFAEGKVKNTKPVIFAAFAGEEAGLLGSDAFAKELANGAKAIPSQCKPSIASESSFLQNKHKRKMASGAIIMDEIGWLAKTNMYSAPTVNLESHDDSGAFTGMNEMMQHLVNSNNDHNKKDGKAALNVVHSNNPFGSDHMSFLQLKMPAVLTIQGDDEAYPDYHKATDKIENVNFDYATQIVKMNMGALIRMAGVQDGEAKEAKADEMILAKNGKNSLVDRLSREHSL